MLSPLAAEFVHHPRNVGPLLGATHIGTSGIPGEGPFVKIWLKIESEQVIAAAYQTHGCPSSVAAASLVTQLVIGKDLNWIQELSPRDVLVILGGLPEGKEKFAFMAVDALQSALSPQKSGETK